MQNRQHSRTVDLIMKLNKKVKETNGKINIEEVIKIFSMYKNEKKLPDFDGRALSMLLTAISKSKLQNLNKNIEICEEIFLLIKNHIKDCGQREISNVMTALSKIGIKWNKVPNELPLMSYIEDVVEVFDRLGIVNTLTACARMDYRWDNFSSKLQAGMLSSIKDNIKKFTDQNISNTFWALARMGCNWNDLSRDLQLELIEAVKNKVIEKPAKTKDFEVSHVEEADVESQHVANILWAMMVFQIRDNKELIYNLFYKIRQYNFTCDGARSLQRTRLYFGFEDKEIIEKIESMLISGKEDKITTSGTHRETHKKIENILQNCFRNSSVVWDIQDEFEIAKGMPVDMLVTIKQKGRQERKILIEVNGPDHERRKHIDVCKYYGMKYLKYKNIIIDCYDSQISEEQWRDAFVNPLSDVFDRVKLYFNIKNEDQNTDNVVNKVNYSFLIPTKKKLNPNAVSHVPSFSNKKLNPNALSHIPSHIFDDLSFKDSDETAMEININKVTSNDKADLLPSNSNIQFNINKK